MPQKSKLGINNKQKRQSNRIKQAKRDRSQKALGTIGSGTRSQTAARKKKRA